MIKIKIYRKEDLITGFELSGHAESGPYGYDLVCAGVSAVSFGSVNAVDTLCDIDLNVTMAENGYLEVLLPENISSETEKKTQLIFEAMIISLITIENDYKEFITIIDK